MLAAIVTHMVILLQFQQWEDYKDDTLALASGNTTTQSLATR